MHGLPAVRFLGLLVAVLLLASPAGRADEQDRTSFSVLTYNTHGLPSWIARDDPATRFPRLLAKAERFDLVLLQEDFAHQELVDEQHRHAALVRGNGPRRNFPGMTGSGLTLLTHLEILGPPLRKAYESCHGWLTAASDCFGNKGFLMQRIGLENGAEIEVWNTHLEAGSNGLDDAVRREQLELLAYAIESQEGDRSIVVGGDFNLDWDDERDRELLEAWLARLGLEKAAMAPPGTWGSRLDYLFFRSGSDSVLELTEGGMRCDFIGPRGAPLSDHPAIFATFTVR